MNGGGYVNENGSIKAIVNKQYNTPVGIYSDESIAETLSAQAEVLAGGVLGLVSLSIWICFIIIAAPKCISTIVWFFFLSRIAE